jgi:hypothetical protein
VKQHKLYSVAFTVLGLIGVVAGACSRREIEETQSKALSPTAEPRLQIVERRWDENLIPPKKQILTLYVQNVGQSPAKNVRAAALIVQGPRGRAGEQLAFKSLIDSLPKTDVQASDTGVNEKFWLIAQGHHELAQEQWKMFQTGERPLYVVTLMKYAGTSGKEYNMETCDFLWGQELNQYTKCQSHNTSSLATN